MNLINLFNGLSDLQKILATVIVSIILYATTTTLSYSVFSNAYKASRETEPLITALPGPATALEEDPGEPKTEECPLNGSKRSKKAKENWEARRPLAVMVENHVESRPQSGLSAADIIYEAIAEGGITRFAAIYLCNLSDVQVGPVRSARTYFLDWVLEYDALYAHVGGANTPGPADALGQILKYGIKDLNQFGIGFPTFWRDYQRLGRPVATEHTMYSTTKKLWEVGVKRGWTAQDGKGKKWDDNFISWKFKDDQPSSTLADIKVDFWEGQDNYRVEWVYEESCSCYKRKHQGVEQIDLNNKKPLTVKNIVVQFQRESNANDGYENNVHLLYGTLGKGKALIFQDGKVIEGQWTKVSRLARSRYFDKSGKEISFNRGQIWIQTVPEGAKVVY